MMGSQQISGPICLNGAQILQGDHLVQGSVCIEGGRISAQGGRAVDLSDCLLLPGMVDLHHIDPRRHLSADPQGGLSVVAGQLAANGITTAYLPQHWDRHDGAHSPCDVRTLAAALSALSGRTGGVDLRMQLRVAPHMIAQFNAIARFVRATRLDYVVFDGGPPGGADVTPQPAANDMQIRLALDRLIAELPPVRLGWHGADHRSLREDLQIPIVEFAQATTGDVVQAARDVDRNGFRAGAVASAGDAQSLLRAVRVLVGQGMALPQAWHMVSAGPAAIMDLADRGHVAVGQRADLVVLDRADLSLMATFAGGCVIWSRAGFAERLIG